MNRSTIKLSETCNNTPRRSRRSSHLSFIIYKPSKEYKDRTPEYTLKYPREINRHYRPSEELKMTVIRNSPFNMRYIRTIKYDNFFLLLADIPEAIAYVPKRYRNKKFLLKCVDVNVESVPYMYNEDYEILFKGKDRCKTYATIFSRCADVRKIIYGFEYWNKPFPHKIQNLIINRLKSELEEDDNWGWIDGYIHTHWSRSSWFKIVERDPFAIFRSHDDKNMKDSALINFAIKQNSNITEKMCYVKASDNYADAKNYSHRRACLTLRNIKKAISEHSDLLSKYLASPDLNNRQKQSIVSKYIDDMSLSLVKRFYPMFTTPQKTFVQLKYGSELKL